MMKTVSLILDDRIGKGYYHEAVKTLINKEVVLNHISPIDDPSAYLGRILHAYIDNDESIKCNIDFCDKKNIYCNYIENGKFWPAFTIFYVSCGESSKMFIREIIFDHISLCINLENIKN